MKKVLIVLLSLLVLCGCGSKTHVSSVSEGQKVLFVAPDGTEYTKAEAYEAAKKFDISDTLTNNLTKQICEFEEIDLDGLQEEAEQQVKDAEENGYSYYIDYYYGGTDAFIESYIIQSSLIKLKAKYASLDVEKYNEQYKPFKAEVASFDDETTANNVLAAAKNSDSTFAYACSSNGYESEITETVYTSNSSLPDEVMDYIENAKVGISDVIKCDNVTTDSEGNSTTTSTYYVVNLISNNVEEFKDDFFDAIASDIDTTEVINYYLNVYQIEVHDQDIYDILSSSYEGIK